MKEMFRKLVVAVVVVGVAALVWQFGIKPRMRRFQAWEGTVAGKYRLRDPERDVDTPHRAEHLSYAHYWRVITSDGKKRDVEIPYRLWETATEGQKAIKKSGDRWPELLPMTEEDKREAIAKGYIQKEEPAAPAVGGDAEGRAFLEENAKKEDVVVLPSGLQYKVIAQGAGPSPKAADRVRVNYRGRFINGKEFDSSYQHGGPATFAVNGVIKGWTEALQLMKAGSKWEVYVPSELAYGEKAPPQIGPNKTLIFEVELLEVVSR